MSRRDLAAVLRLACGQHGAVSAAQALAFGLTRSEIGRLRARGDWSSLLSGVYLVHRAQPAQPWRLLPLPTRVSAAVLAHGGRSVFTGDTAARLLGMPGLGPDRGDVHLTLPTGTERHQQVGVRVHTGRLPPESIQEIDMAAPEGAGAGVALRVTTVPHTTATLLRSLGRWDAVSLLDAALAEGRLEPRGLDDVVRLLPGRRGAVAARRHIRDSDARAQSPLETRIRLIAADHGYPAHVLQYPVRDAFGVLLGYGDLAWLRAGRRTLVAEADGKIWHETPEAVFRDRRRANDFSATGSVDVVRFTWADTLHPAYVAGVLRDHLQP